MSTDTKHTRESSTEQVEITPELLAEIDSAAGAATEGEWKQGGPSIYSKCGNVATCGNPHASTLVGFTPSSYADSDRDLAETFANAEYIALVQPSVATALVRRIRELESAEPMEMALCEQDGVSLRPDQPYIFRVLPGCEKCAALASVYT